MVATYKFEMTNLINSPNVAEGLLRVQSVSREHLSSQWPCAVALPDMTQSLICTESALAMGMHSDLTRKR